MISKINWAPLMTWVLLLFSLHTFSTAHANPYFDPSKVPQNKSYGPLRPLAKISHGMQLHENPLPGVEVIRVAITTGREAARSFSVARIVKETSGTEAFLRRARQPSKIGSFRAMIRDKKSGQPLSFDSIGTGQEYARLVDELSFRFPIPSDESILELIAENPVSGKMELVLRHKFNPDDARTVDLDTAGLEIRELKRPRISVTGRRLAPSVRVNIYAEGYLASRSNAFWSHAQNAVAALVKNQFPMVETMHFFGVFAPSKATLGDAQNLGRPIPEFPTRLGLYFPYWENFGRWYHVVYPTREEKYRQALAVAPYDYKIVLVDDSQYWGVGNFRSPIAIPAASSSSIYILLHEFGHYFGLNEEYEQGGRTELEFAPGIDEPWSQNITFLRSGNLADLKWREFVLPTTPIPTSENVWDDSPPIYGAYEGGYAGSPPMGHSHKPGFGCVMNNGANFCQICRRAIEDVVKFDMGLATRKQLRSQR